MIIRQEQMRALDRGIQQNFERNMVHHLQEFAPELSRIAGPESLRAFVDGGIRTAVTYGFSSRGAAQLYLELMCTFGKCFDTDPALAWVRSHLTGTQREMVRSQALYEAAIDYLDAVVGPKNELQIAAIQRARGIEPVQLTQMPGTFESRILNLFQHVYPEKAVKAGG